MLSPTTIWIAFALYMCFLLGVAVYVTVQDKKKAAGGSLLTASVKWPVLVMTYIASLMSTWVFFAGPGAYYRGGLGYWISEMSYIALFPIIAHFTMNKVWIINREMGGTFSTPADFYDARFKSRALRIILALIFLCASFPYIASVLVAIANAAQYATDGAINYRLAVIVVGLIMTVFVCVGGVKSAATADTVQGLLFILLLWVIVIAALIVGFGGSLSKAVTKLWDDVPSFFSYPGPDGWVPYASRFGYPFSCAIGWTIMLPHVFVRSRLLRRRSQGAAPPFLHDAGPAGHRLDGHHAHRSHRSRPRAGAADLRDRAHHPLHRKELRCELQPGAREDPHGRVLHRRFRRRPFDLQRVPLGRLGHRGGRPCCATRSTWISAARRA